jgi:glycosyltransferase involved in cell wall biosynthesis
MGINIAYIVPSLSNSAPNIMVKDLIEEIKKYVNTVDIYYLKDICELTYPCQTFPVRFYDSIAFDKYDIFHSHMMKADMFLFFNRKRIKGKCVSTLHQYNLPNFRMIYKFNIFNAYMIDMLWNIFLSKHDKIVTITRNMNEYYRRYYFNKNITHIYNGRYLETCCNDQIGIEDEFRIRELKNKFYIIGMCCIINYIKGIDQVVQVLTIAKQFALIVVGDGPEKDNLIKLSKKLRVNDRCLFLGLRNNSCSYYKYFDLFIMPSRREGFGLSLIEAAYNRIPTVCSDIPTFREIFNENEVCYFELNNINSLFSTIKKLMNNREYYAINMHKKYITCYTAKTMAQAYLSLYNQLLL